jgi:hypothetical protein
MVQKLAVVSCARDRVAISTTKDVLYAYRVNYFYFTKQLQIGYLLPSGNPRPTELFIRKDLTDERGLNWLVQLADPPVIVGAEIPRCFPHQSVVRETGMLLQDMHLIQR